jgi:catechol-2,3-dioxygenase
MIQVTGLNHAVLYVSDLDRSVAFYTKAFGLEEVTRAGQAMAFLRAAGSENHHDLGLATVGSGAMLPARGSVGLYHLAWQVKTVDELLEALRTLTELDALTGMSDHGATLSLYGRDPDGIEFEVMWQVPREDWGEYENRAVTRRVDLRSAVERYGVTSRR